MWFIYLHIYIYIYIYIIKEQRIGEKVSDKKYVMIIKR